MSSFLAYHGFRGEGSDLPLETLNCLLDVIYLCGLTTNTTKVPMRSSHVSTVLQ